MYEEIFFKNLIANNNINNLIFNVNKYVPNY